ncbi:FCD domain-containing protein [Roseicyclus sp.]|uniref:FCD domain-containing protein n=1 Tax=Roseicyclus sp. TaxID=1914329 RepID=UPI001BCE6991
MIKAQFDPITAETLAQTAYLRLRRDIITGARPPGERLRIAKLKTIYAIGPTPLREALQKLAQDGLVVAHDNRGFAVADLDPVEFADLNTARTAIETEAIRLSLAYGDDGWEARVVAASYIMQKEDAVLARAAGTVADTWERANADFHTAIVSACGSTWMLRLRAQLHDLCERYRRASVYQGLGSRDLGAEHAAIAAAALARDTEQATALTVQHFARTETALAARGHQIPQSAEQDKQDAQDHSRHLGS